MCAGDVTACAYLRVYVSVCMYVADIRMCMRVCVHVCVCVRILHAVTCIYIYIYITIQGSRRGTAEGAIRSGGCFLDFCMRAVFVAP